MDLPAQRAHLAREHHLDAEVNRLSAELRRSHAENDRLLRALTATWLAFKEQQYPEVEALLLEAIGKDLP